jgi:hypothetical protein
MVDNRSMDLLPGDVGFSTIGGRTGVLVAVGQALIGDACRYTHAWISLGSNHVLEAMPGGARVRRWYPKSEGPDRVADDGPVYRLPLEDWQRAEIPWKGEKLVGTPYSFADYGAMALHHAAPDLGITKRVRQYVTDSGHMICSQSVDHLLADVWYHVFDDGRLPQDVTPGDLYYACGEQGVRVA